MATTTTTIACAKNCDCIHYALYKYMKSTLYKKYKYNYIYIYVLIFASIWYLFYYLCAGVRVSTKFMWQLTTLSGHKSNQPKKYSLKFSIVWSEQIFVAYRQCNVSSVCSCACVCVCKVSCVNLEIYSYLKIQTRRIHMSVALL